MITVIGSANVDLILHVPRFPLAGETISASQLVTSLGGKGANQAAAAARAGSDVRFVGRVGKDSRGQELIESLRGSGVTTQFLKIDDFNPTGTAVVIVEESGENTIVVAPGANGALTPADVDAAIEAIGDSKIVLLQMEIPSETVIHGVSVAKGAGAMIILNAAPARSLPQALLEQLDILVLNETEVELLSGMGPPVDVGASAAMLIGNGAREIVVTLGPDGALLVNADREEHIPAFESEVVDTTGAGDAFVGNLAHALESGQELEQAVRFACAASSVAIGRVGAQTSMPSLSETEAVLQRAEVS